MKKLQLTISLFVLSCILLPVFGAPVSAGNGMVVITVTGTDGKKISNMEITCTKTKSSSGGGLPPAPQFTYLKTNSIGVAAWSIAADIAYVYDCTQRTALSPDGCYYALSPSPRNFSLASGQTKSVAIPMKPQTCKPANTSKPAPTKVPDPAAAIAGVTLPASFIQKDTTTSSFANLTTSNAKVFKNLTLEIKGTGKIVWADTVDLSASDLKDKFSKLDQHVKITTSEVWVDFAALPQLNKKAVITLTTSLQAEPVVLQKNMATTEQPNPDWTALAADAIAYNAEQKSTMITITTWAQSYLIDPGLQLEVPPAVTSEKTITFSGKVNSSDVKVMYTMNDTEGKNAIAIPVTNLNFNQKLTVTPGEVTVNVMAVATDNIDNVLANKSFHVTVEAPKLDWWQQIIAWFTNLWH